MWITSVRIPAINSLISRKFIGLSRVYGEGAEKLQEAPWLMVIHWSMVWLYQVRYKSGVSPTVTVQSALLHRRCAAHNYAHVRREHNESSF